MRNHHIEDCEHLSYQHAIAYSIKAPTIGGISKNDLEQPQGIQFVSWGDHQALCIALD